MKKLTPLKIELNDEKSQAEYYFKREFNTIPLDLLKEDYEIINPSDELILEYYFDDYGNKDELIKDYLKENKIKKKEFNVNHFNQTIIKSDEFENYKFEDFSLNHSPMWGYVFHCPNFYINSQYMNTDMLYELGIGVLEHEDIGYCLFIGGAGYDFYEAHWIPLFKKLNWIKYE